MKCFVLFTLAALLLVAGSVEARWHRQAAARRAAGARRAAVARPRATASPVIVNPPVVNQGFQLRRATVVVAPPAPVRLQQSFTLRQDFPVGQTQVLTSGFGQPLLFDEASGQPLNGANFSFNVEDFQTGLGGRVRITQPVDAFALAGAAVLSGVDTLPAFLGNRVFLPPGRRGFRLNSNLPAMGGQRASAGRGGFRLRR